MCLLNTRLRRHRFVPPRASCLRIAPRFFSAAVQFRRPFEGHILAIVSNSSAHSAGCALSTPPSGTRAEIPSSPPCQARRVAKALRPISWALQATPSTSYPPPSSPLLVAKAGYRPPTSDANGHRPSDRGQASVPRRARIRSDSMMSCSPAHLQ